MPGGAVHYHHAAHDDENRFSYREAGGCAALITGESLGQVASQTIHAIACTDAAAGLPVFRPLIGMDKEEIVRISRKIEAFDISIQPYEDCCTVFTPKHPPHQPVLKILWSWRNPAWSGRKCSGKRRIRP